ncbi:MAG: alcohol dehydrogenase [Calditrichaeota bacterium]|nr:MAG: alcohol dehydrogenase [Calditrichota bacterium]
MKTVLFYKHGAPDVLKTEERPLSEPGTGEVRIQMKTVALNHLDIWVRQGIPGVPLPMIPGSDGAGVVDKTGEGAHRFKKGDAVIHVPLRVPDDDPLQARDMENLSPDFKIPGEQVPGTFREYMCVPERYLLPKPGTLNWEQAAALPLASLTAYHMLLRKVTINAGETVLIYGASSGVGSAGIQIAKARGARVITTAGSAEKEHLALALGADHVIRYDREPIGKTVKALTRGKGVDVVFEHTGAQTWPESLRSLKKGGAIVTCGATTGYDVRIDLRALFIKHQRIIGSTMGTLGDMHAVCALAEAGKLTPPVGKVFDGLDATAEAHRWLENGRQLGKVVIRVV